MQHLLHALYGTSSCYGVHNSFLKALHLNGDEAFLFVENRKQNCGYAYGFR
jgi:hypothetical protein